MKKINKIMFVAAEILLVLHIVWECMMNYGAYRINVYGEVTDYQILANACFGGLIGIIVAAVSVSLIHVALHVCNNFKKVKAA